MTKVTREAIHEELKALSTAGALTPAKVVEQAADGDSPLHSIFEWNDSEAARKYRLDQARNLINSFTVIRTVDETEYRVQEFVEDPRKPENEQGYVHFDTITTDEQLKRQFISRELGVASTHVSKTREYAGALGLLPEVAKVQRELYELRQKVEGGATA